MIIKTFIEPPIENNNYLLIDEESKEAVLIDCSGMEANEDLLLELKKHNATLKYILLTHGHFDHITGVPSYPDVEVLMYEDDMGWVNNLNMYLPMLGLPEMEIPKIDRFIVDSEIIKLGEKEIKVIHTPGHTQGGVCFLIENNLFSGDTIFRESVGRCDLEGGDFEQIVESIENKIFTLPPKTTIFPGHGNKTTVEWEKAHNKFL